MFLLYFVVGVLSGIIGGMGMGGGTVLIPVLTLFFGVSQHEAQAVNLVSFIPMAAVSLFIHFKKGRIKTKGLLFIIIPAVIFSVFSSLLASQTDGDLLKKLFGGFLVLLSAFQFVSALNDKS
ncbi:MAG: sulfite exporter TauE/SafE family protein [Clostridia bacterium]|nr:sulfite exporter TauE/SafE family protein [Clostridia bacterium]